MNQNIDNYQVNSNLNENLTFNNYISWTDCQIKYLNCTKKIGKKFILIQSLIFLKK